MTSIQALRERRSVLAQSLHALVNQTEGKDWKPEHQSKYDEGMSQITDIDTEIGRFQAVLDKINDDALESRGKETKAKAIRENGGASMYARWLRGGDRSITAEEWAGIRATLSTTTGSEGGYTVQTEVAKSVADALKAYGGMREVSTVIQTAGVGDLNFPTSDGTSETGELIGQNTTATAADPTFGVVSIVSYKFSSKIVAVPFELLQDSSVDIEAFVNNRLATRIGRATNTYFTTGTGTAQPRGVVTAAASGKVGTSGQTVTVIYDDLVDLIHSVDPEYRKSPACRFMMADSSLKVVRKLKDSQNRPIFLPGYDLNAKMPDTILGYGITINQDMAAMAANAKSILFGDFSKYIIRDVMGVTMFRFDDSAYIKLGQIGFLAWSRSGGNFVDVGGAVKYYANSAT
jgi:HK97 family phage major capsid protein